MSAPPAPTLARVNDDGLPFALAAALRLEAVGAGHVQIAALDIAPEAVDTELELAARKLARRQRERAPGSAQRPTGAG